MRASRRSGLTGRLQRSTTLTLLLAGLPPFRLILGGVAGPLSALLPQQRSPTPVALRTGRPGETAAWTRDVPIRSTFWVAACVGAVIMQTPRCSSIGLQ